MSKNHIENASLVSVIAAAVPAGDYARMQAACCAYVRENCDQGRYMDRLVGMHEELRRGR